MNASTILDRVGEIINRDDYIRGIGLVFLLESIKWIENEGDYTHMEYLDVSQTTVAGTKEYDVPARFKREIDCYLEDSTHRIIPLTQQRSTIPDRYAGIHTNQQKPTSYNYFADHLFLSPAPDGVYSIGQRCYVYSEELTDSVNSSNKLTENHGLLLICLTVRNLLTYYEDYDSSKIWNNGSGDGQGHNFRTEWDAFLKKESKKQGPISGTRIQIRMK